MITKALATIGSICLAGLVVLGFSLIFLRGATWIDDMAEEDENEEWKL